MAVLSPYKEAVDTVKEEGGEQFKLCFQCGLCTAACPWNRVISFLPRRLVHQAQLGVVDFEDESLWVCVACKQCVQRCPRSVQMQDIVRALRRVTAEVGAGKIPESLRITAKNMSGTGNPLGESPEKRTDWAKGLDVKTYTTGTELLYFVCCYQAYDASARKVAVAMVDILNKAGVDFGIVDNNQSCCGESIRKAGHEAVFQDLVKNNMGIFEELEVSRVLTTSPHCYHTLKSDYLEAGADFGVIYAFQVIMELIEEGRLKFNKQVGKKVTYHDSCLVGRYEGLYDEPRRVLASIPGVELVEMRENYENALCCGGGGGKLWQETKKGERLSDIRLQQAIDTGANVLAVGCPYCRLNFEDSLLTSGKEGDIEVKDVVELVQEAL